MRGARPAATVCVLALLLVACDSAPSTSATPEASAGTPPTACEPIDLRLPSGDPIDLTGTWTGDDGLLYFVVQSESCIWWEAMNEVPEGEESPHGCCLRTVFWGTLGSDFSLTGHFAVIYRSPTWVPPGAQGVVFPQHGDAEWNIRFPEIAGAGDMTLVGESLMSVNGERSPVMLTRVSERTELP